MDITTFRRLLTDHNTELVRYISRNLPIKAGAAARSFVRENFRLGGFRDGAITKWQVTRRQLTGKGADAKRGPLLSSRRVLYGGTNYNTGLAKLKFIEDKTAVQGRYEIYCAWKGRKDGHVFIVERQKNGNLLWYDPQNGRRGGWMDFNDNYINKMQHDQIGVLRIDDKIINPKFGSRLLKSDS